VSSTDLNRYLSDGRVQLSGVSPYRYAPFDDRLAHLRDPILFPRLGPDERSGWTTQPLPHDRAGVLQWARNDPRTVISRPRFPTPYPPVAQAYFTAVSAVTPWSWGVRGFQIAGGALAVAIAGMLAAELRRRRRDPSYALVWAWCPTVVLEAGNGGHLDVLVTFFVVLACVTAARRASALTVGLLVGLAAAAKLTPLVLVPAFTHWRRGRAGLGGALRRSVVQGGTALGVVVLGYVPHLLVVGALAAGSIRGYLLEEAGENRASLLALVLPPDVAGAAAVVICLGVVAWAVFRRPVPEAGEGEDAAAAQTGAAATDDPARPALYLFATLIFTTTPVLAWYTLPLIALVCLAGRPEFLALAVAGHVAYGGHSCYPATPIGYALALISVHLVTMRRLEHRRRVAGPTICPGDQP
jgi:hypothetical protein